MSDKPRLPALPYAPYAPPPRVGTHETRVEASVHADEDQEVFNVTVSKYPDGGELSLFTTQRAWGGIDVYLTVNPGAGIAVSGCASVFVYAISGGVRAIVATGRLFIASASLPAPPYVVETLPKWIAAARSVTSRFEVTVEWNQTAGLSQPGSITVAAVASNHITQAPFDDVGSLPGNLAESNVSGVSSNLGYMVVGGTQARALELLAVQGCNTVAAPRWLHLYDMPPIPFGGGVIPGSIPLFVWPLGAVIGSGMVDRSIRYRVRRGLVLTGSSTAFTTTETADVVVQATVR